MFEKANIGDDFIFVTTGLNSKVVDKTSSSICLYNKKTNKKGIDSTNWYEKTWFERKFKEIN